MTKYTQITFTKLSEAIAYLENGGYLCQSFDATCASHQQTVYSHGIDISELTSIWVVENVRTFHTKSKPSQWYEKLDGTVENGVLCWIKDYSDKARCVDLVVKASDKTYEVVNSYDGSLAQWECATPMTRAEIQLFMNNAPEEV